MKNSLKNVLSLEIFENLHTIIVYLARCMSLLAVLILLLVLCLLWTLAELMSLPLPNSRSSEMFRSFFTAFFSLPSRPWDTE